MLEVQRRCPTHELLDGVRGRHDLGARDQVCVRNPAWLGARAARPDLPPVLHEGTHDVAQRLEPCLCEHGPRTRSSLATRPRWSAARSCPGRRMPQRSRRQKQAWPAPGRLLHACSSSKASPSPNPPIPVLHLLLGGRTASRSVRPGTSRARYSLTSGSTTRMSSLADGSLTPDLQHLAGSQLAQLGPDRRRQHRARLYTALARIHEDAGVHSVQNHPC